METTDARSSIIKSGKRNHTRRSCAVLLTTLDGPYLVLKLHRM